MSDPPIHDFYRSRLSDALRICMVIAVDAQESSKPTRPLAQMKVSCVNAVGRTSSAMQSGPAARIGSVKQLIDQAVPTVRMVIIDRMTTTDATAVEAPADTIMEEVVPAAICPTEQTVIMDRTVIMAPMVITDRMDLVTTDTTAIIERVCAKPIWHELSRHQSCIGHND
ncbi:hypothetical protein PV11_06780 [Exophiala sideris]|uniref:Uncharacterized protein n=1 Tax=Exophiala sideris TaxID=1016849 RepID=A0A0D1YEI4_9EURO|nr:hypothetical protein PV11_06780 [Exophiala sideris]